MGGAGLVWWGLFPQERNLTDITLKGFRRQMDSGGREGRALKEGEQMVFPPGCSEWMEGEA